MQQPKKSSNGQSERVSGDIHKIRDQLANDTLNIFAALGLIALIASLFRYFEHGWLFVFYLQILGYLILLGIVYYKKKMAYIWRVRGILGLLFVNGLLSLVTYGMVGMGILMLLTYTVLAVVFGGVRPGKIAAAASLTVLGIAGLLTVLGFLPVSPAIVEGYASSQYAWIAQLAAFIMFVGLIVINSGNLQNHLMALINQLEKNTADIKAKEKELSESNHMLQNVLNTIPVRVFWKDTNYIYRGGNRLFAQDAGVEDPSQLVGLDDFSMTWDKGANERQVEDQRIIDSQQPLINEERSYITHEGQTLWQDFSLFPLKDAEEKIIGVIGTYMDITERKKSEEILRIMGFSVDNSQNAIWWVDPNGRFSYVNEAACTMLGYNRLELQEKAFIDIDAEFSKDAWSEGDFQAYKEVGVTRLVRNFRRKDGSEFPVGLTVKHMEFEGREYLYVSGADITERKRAEKALEISERLFRTLYESAPVGIALLDMEGRPLVSNKALEEFLGYNEEQLRTMSFVQFTHPDDRDKDWDNFLEIVTGKRNMYSLEKRFNHSDGRTVWGFWAVSLTRDNKGRPQNLIGMVQDITNRKTTEWALRKNEEQMRLVTDALPGLIAFVDSERKYRFVNKAYEDLYNLKREQIVGMHVSELIGEEAYRGIEGYVDTVLSGEDVVYEDLIHNKDGTERWVNAHYVSDFGPEDQVVGFVALIQDITERKQAEKALLLTQHTIDYAGEAIGWIVGGKFIYVNDRTCRLLGYTREEIYSKYYNEIMPEMVSDDGEKIWETTREKGTYTFEAGLKTKAGKTIQSEISATFMQYESIEYSLVFARDITMRKKAELALKENEKRLDLALNAAQLAIWDWHLDNKEMFFSPKWAQILGYKTVQSPLEIEAALKLVHEDDQKTIRNLIDELTSGNKSEVNVEIRIINKSGNYIWLQIQARITEVSETGKPMRLIGIARDITDRKRAEEELLNYQSQLKALATKLMEAGQEERKNIATYLHDGVCQFLSSANLQISLFKDQETSDEKIKKITKIQETVKSAYKVSSSLTFDLYPPALSELGLEAAVEKLLEEFEDQSDVKTFFMNEGPEINLKRNMRSYVYRIIHELVTNVRKHSSAKTLNVDIKRASDKMIVTVADDGLGFDLNEIKAPGTKKSGFGLFSIREQLNPIGGKMEIRAARNSGTRVDVLIPYNPEDLGA